MGKLIKQYSGTLVFSGLGAVMLLVIWMFLTDELDFINPIADMALLGVTVIGGSTLIFYIEYKTPEWKLVGKEKSATDLLSRDKQKVKSVNGSES